MREFYDGILSFIVAAALSDDEFAAITYLLPIYTQESYEALAGVLQTRENVSIQQERLVMYFTAKGVSVAPKKTSQSNIFLGSVL